jgi:ribosome-binding ATPase
MLKKSHSLSIGIVGLPNSGKSTLFNSLTQNAVPAENFPFCTIDKNVGIVEIPDERLKKLVDFFEPEKIVPSVVKFVDIAGLVKGASKGEGLGNQFLGHIREVDVILYVLRAFESESISHVYNRVNPYEDFEIVQAELIFKDIEVLEKYVKEFEKNHRVNVSEEDAKKQKTMERVLGLLNKGIPIVEMGLTQVEVEYFDDLSLLTSKERIFVLNVREGVNAVNDEKDLENFSEKEFILKVDVKMIGEFVKMDDMEKKEFLDMLDEGMVMMEDLISLVYKRLDLITFYTGNEKECNAWSIVRGSTVKEAAGVVHSDLSKGFITSEVINVEKMIEVGGWSKGKDLGLIKKEGKDYIVKDGDYVVILAN